MNTGMISSEIEAEIAKVYPQIQKEVHKAFLESASEMAAEQLQVCKSIIEVEGLDYKPSMLPSQQLVTNKASELNLIVRGQL